MDWKAYADELLAEFNMCCQARPYNNTVDIQLEKESCGKWAYHLNTQRGWGTDSEIAEACHQLAPRLKKFREKVITDILQSNNGSI